MESFFEKCANGGGNGGGHEAPRLDKLITGLAGVKWGTEEQTGLGEELTDRRALLSKASNLAAKSLDSLSCCSHNCTKESCRSTVFDEFDELVISHKSSSV